MCLVPATAIAGAGALVGARPVAAATAAIVWVLAAVAFRLVDCHWSAPPRRFYVAAGKTWAASSLLTWLIGIRAFPATPGLIVVALPLAAVAAAIVLRAASRAIAVRRRTRVVVVDAVGEKRLPAWIAYYWPEWEIVDFRDGRDLPAAEREAAAQAAAVACYLNGQSPAPRGRLHRLSLDELLERMSGRVLLDHAERLTCGCGRGGAAIKRAVDLCAAAGGLAVLAPLLVVLAALIKLESKGPAIYRQRRLGLDCQPFRMLKFRSMADQAEQETGPVWATPNDPRCTRLGRLLRPLHLDELPQLVNVLRGEMSLVGPRPERPELAEDLLATMPVYRKRLSVKPGVTGWAQVNQGYDRALDDVRRKLEYDLFYVKRCGPLLDAGILLRTIDAVIFGKPRRPARPELP